MLGHRLTQFTLLSVFAFSLGCADDGGSQDEADETGSEGESTGTDSESGSESTGSESGSTDDEAETSPESTDEAETSPDESTDEAETSPDESTDEAETAPESTDDATDEAETSPDDTGTETGDEIMCPDVFPAFDKSCEIEADCAIVIHTTDCCGNSVAWGLNHNEVEAFEAAEAICDSQYPPCGCPAGPPVAEDGDVVVDPDGLAVECAMGSCMSYVP